MHSNQTLETEDNKSSISEKIQLLTTLVHLVRSIIDLGYLSKDQICKIVKPLLKLYSPFLTAKEKVHLRYEY
jgi:hypothetical protein